MGKTKKPSETKTYTNTYTIVDSYTKRNGTKVSKHIRRVQS